MPFVDARTNQLSLSVYQRLAIHYHVVLIFSLFLQIPEILQIHQEFLIELSDKTEHWSPEQGIGQVILNKVSTLLLYIPSAWNHY